VTRRTVFELKKADERFHVLLGLLVAVDHIDRVIQIIRASSDPEIAKQSLVVEEFTGNLPQFPGVETPQLQEAHKLGYFKLSEAQAKAILDLRLHRLTGLEREKLLAEAGEVKTAIQRLREILSNEKVLMGVIEGELLEIKEKYCKDGPDRKTQLVPDEGEIALEDLIAEEDVVVTVSHTGYIKRSSLSMYRAQKRGGKGKTGMATKEDDFVTDLFVSSTHDTMLAFTNKGRVFSKKVYEIPAANPNARGKAIVNFVQLEKDEKVAAFIPVSEFSIEGTAIVFATRNGVVKKTVLSLFANIRQNGIIALLIDNDDQLIAARVVQTKQEMFLGTKDGYSIRFSEEELRPIGRQARGVRGITLREGDHVVGMEVLSENTETILTVCENGFGKRTEVSEYRDQHRGGSGILTIKASERNGPVMGFARVADEDQIMVVTNKGSLIRTPTKGISVLGRNTQGVRIINIDEEGEKVVALARLPREETSEDSTHPQAVLPSTSAAPAPGSATNGTNGAPSNGAPTPDLDLN
jgi:DNA gyrase subunit A